MLITSLINYYCTEIPNIYLRGGGGAFNIRGIRFMKALLPERNQREWHGPLALLGGAVAVSCTVHSLVAQSTYKALNG